MNGTGRHQNVAPDKIFLISFFLNSGQPNERQGRSNTLTTLHFKYSLELTGNNYSYDINHRKGNKHGNSREAGIPC